MRNYKIWKDENNEYELLIEIFNDCDVLNVQKEFVNNGYIIKEYFKGTYHTFIRVYKYKELENGKNNR